MAQSDFHPSDDDIHHMIEHDFSSQKGKSSPKNIPVKKPEISWRKSSVNNPVPPKRTIIDDEKDAISPHFDV